MGLLRKAVKNLVDLAVFTGKYSPKHMFPMKTTFRNCFLVNFSMEPHVLKAQLPPGLEPDIYNGSLSHTLPPSLSVRAWDSVCVHAQGARARVCVCFVFLCFLLDKSKFHTFVGKAFLSVVIADLESMRIGYFPKWLGNSLILPRPHTLLMCLLHTGSDFTQVVYRAIVRSD